MDGAFDQVKATLAINLKRMRKGIGFSQEALALAAEVDRTYVSQIERQIGNPSLLILCRLAATLKTDVTSLLSDNGGVT